MKVVFSIAQLFLVYLYRLISYLSQHDYHFDHIFGGLEYLTAEVRAQPISHVHVNKNPIHGILIFPPKKSN